MFVIVNLFLSCPHLLCSAKEIATMRKALSLLADNFVILLLFVLLPRESGTALYSMHFAPTWIVFEVALITEDPIFLRAIFRHVFTMGSITHIAICHYLRCLIK